MRTAQEMMEARERVDVDREQTPTKHEWDDANDGDDRD